VIVTGSRAWPDAQAVFQALTKTFLEHGPFELRHGACATGADHDARLWFEFFGKDLGCTEVRFPANWERGPQAGPERNRRMVEAGADLVLAFPEVSGSGTQMTVRLAKEAGIPVREYGPDGILREGPTEILGEGGPAE
jgi:hypothetical protein